MLPLYKKISELKTREESEKEKIIEEKKKQDIESKIKDVIKQESENKDDSELESESESESSIFGEGDNYDYEVEEELQVDIIEKNNPCSEMLYDPNRVEFRYQYEDKGLIAVRKGICFKCSSYRMIIFTNVNDGYNSCQICERCIQAMLDDARNN